MTEAVALTLPADASWRLLGSAPEGKPVEVVLRSFDRAVLFAVGAGRAAPSAEPIEVAPGQGARLEGLHFFARPGPGSGPARILVRGV